MAAVTRRTKLHIHFKEENNVVSIEKVFQPEAGPGEKWKSLNRPGRLPQVHLSANWLRFRGPHALV